MFDFFLIFFVVFVIFLGVLVWGVDDLRDVLTSLV